MLVPLDLQQFAQFVKGIRKALKLTQAELGESLGVEQASISRWENGGEPSIESYQAFMNFIVDQDFEKSENISDGLLATISDLKRSRQTLEIQAGQLADLAERYIERLKTVFKAVAVIRDEGVVDFDLTPEENKLSVQYAPQMNEELRAVCSVVASGAFPQDRYWFYIIDQENTALSNLDNGSIILGKTTDGQFLVGRSSQIGGTNLHIISNDLFEKAYRLKEAWKVRAILPHR